LNATTTIASPAVQGRRAGIVSRFVADAADLLLVIALVGFIYLGLAAARFLIAPRRFQWPAIGTLPLSALAWGLLIVYLAAAWSATGRSVGKQIMGLRVERLDGSGLGPGVAFIRAFLSALFPIGLFWSAFSRRSASVQDLLVRTKVVYDWLPRVPVRAEAANGDSNDGFGG
jgi:uncharacterized RDD family membrane protein YckC